MFRLTSVALVTTLSFAAVAAEEQSAPSGGHAQVVALNTNRDVVAEQPLSLDDYAGVYETEDGAVFVVARAGDSLAIELPETMALPIRAAGGPSFVLDATNVRFAFETVGGEVRMVVFSEPGAEPEVARRVLLPRGVVTIQDI